MACNTTPYGLRDVWVIGSCGVVKSQLCAQQLDFDPQYSENELKCNDKVQATNTILEKLNFTLNFAGIPLGAYGIMTGSGQSAFTDDQGNPARASVVKAPQTMPYFCIVGKAVGDSGDDVHIRIPRAKLSSGPSGSFQQDNFFVSSMTGVAIPDENGVLFEIVNHEIEAPLQLDCFPESWGPEVVLDAGCVDQDNSTLVANWMDQTSNENDGLQSVLASQPLYLLQDQDGQRSVQFDGVDDYLLADTEKNAAIRTYIVSFCVDNDDFSSSQAIWGNDKLMLEIRHDGLTPPGAIGVRGAINFNDYVVGPTAILGECYTAVVRHDGVQVGLRINGVDYGSSPFTQSNNGDLYIGAKEGAGGTASFFFGGRIKYMAVFDTYLDNECIEQIEASLEIC